jgi:hypothetical protein
MLIFLIFIILTAKGRDCRVLRGGNNFYVLVEKKVPPYVPVGHLWRGCVKILLFSVVMTINQKYTKM